MKFFYANSKYENWEACRQNNIFGVRKNFVDVQNGDLILLRITGHSKNPYGVKAIWKAIDILPVTENTFVPWEDGPYNWIVRCEPIAEFKNPFSEKFVTKHKKSQKIDNLYSSGVMGSIGKLDEQKIIGYLNGILNEKTDELLSFKNEGNGSAYQTLLSIQRKLKGITLIRELPDENYVSDLDDEEFPEGKKLTLLHKLNERNSRAAKMKKSQVLKETGKLICEACQFDFVEIYGVLGSGFAECHHLIPVSSLQEGHVTKLEDLAIVCSNCHSMLHKSRPMLSVDELKELIVTIRKTISPS